MNVGSIATRLRFKWNGAKEYADAGRQWYPNAYQWCQAQAAEFGYSTEQVAAVVAVLSPRVQWAVNMRAARDLLAGDEPKGPYGPNVDKAVRILEGEPVQSALGGPKVTAFHRAIMGDTDAIVLDSIMSYVLGVDASVFSSDVKRSKLEHVIRRLAERVHHEPRTVQATLWIAERGKGD